MNIISIPFFAFALMVILVYSRLELRAQNIWLLIVSYLFYFTWGWQYAVILLVLTSVNYWIGLLVDGKSAPGKRWLRLGLIINVASLIALKLIASAYGMTLVNFLGGKISNVSQLAFLLPVGFSFYILQATSYLIDVSRGQMRPVADFVNFSLYLAYFPKLLSGPLERAGQFIPQLERAREVGNRQIGHGLGLILVGLLRKLVIADGLSALRPVDILAKPVEYSIIEHAVWLIVFAFILYNDFAGYTSIVRGISTMLGIELSKNFSQPFFANSFSDFWNRWHITLSAWLRDYIFFPLRRWCMKKRYSSWVILIVPPLLTMIASGYWHGATFAMLSWGGLHGVYQIIEQKFRKSSRPEGIYHVISVALIFIFVTLAWIPFTSTSFFSALSYVKIFLPPYRFDFSLPVFVNLIAALSLSLFLDWQEFKAASHSYFLDWPAKKQSRMLFISLLILVLFAGSSPDVSNFIYQGF